MKYSTFVVATFGVSCVTAFPFLERVGGLLKWGDHKRQDEELENLSIDLLRGRTLPAPRDDDSQNQGFQPGNAQPPPQPVDSQPPPQNGGFQPGGDQPGNSQPPPQPGQPPSQNGGFQPGNGSPMGSPLPPNHGPGPGNNQPGQPPSQNGGFQSGGDPGSSNVVADGFHQIATGGDVKVQILRIVKDNDLSKDIIVYIKTPGIKEKIVAALSNKDLLKKLAALLNDDAFIESIASAASDGRLGKAFMAINMEMGAWQLLQAILKDGGMTQAVKDLLGPNPDLAAVYMAQVGRQSVMHLRSVIISGFGPQGPKFAQSLEKTFADPKVQMRIRDMMEPHANFGVVLGKTMMDQGAMQHVGDLMGFNPTSMSAMKNVMNAENMPATMMKQAFGSMADSMMPFVEEHMGKGNALDTMVKALPVGNFNTVMMSMLDKDGLAELADDMEKPAQLVMSALQANGVTGRLAHLAVRQGLHRRREMAVLNKRAPFILGFAAVAYGVAVAGAAYCSTRGC